MKKLLRPGDILLLGLAGALDIFEEIRDPLGIMAHGCQTMYGWVPDRYKKHNFIRLVERQLKTKNIEKEIKNGEIYLRLTSEGKEKIQRDFPLLSFQNQKWDKRWRIVVYDIAEISRSVRDALRDKLKQLGFGKLQQSVWITPHDILSDFNEFLEERNLEEEVYTTETTQFLKGDEKVLADKVWHLDKLNEEYQDLLKEIRELKQMYVITHGRGKEVTDKGEKIKELKARYLNILLQDPFLPKELLPEEWKEEEVRKEITKI